jgi:hypothetical protein
MPCDEHHCRLNDELLEILPLLEAEQQQLILRHWRALDLAGKDVLLRSLREPRAADLDLTTLSRLADYFQCGVYDIMRYIRSRR